MIWKNFWWWISIIVPILIAFPFLFKLIIIDKNHPSASQSLGVTIITAIWWVFEPVPIVVTSFVPIVLLPLFGVSTAKSIANSMFTDTSCLSLGGFLFSIAMIKWNLNSRIALKTVLIFGLRPKLLLFGILSVTAILSMWVSNTSAALTMMPNAIAIITKLEQMTGDPLSVKPFAKALCFGTAIASVLGGMSTIVGTPPNVILVKTAEDSFGPSHTIGFTQFLLVGIPTVIICMIFLFIILHIFYMRKVNLPHNLDRSTFQESYEELGPISSGEITILILFCILALLWLFRADMKFGSSFTLKGWASLICKNGSTNIGDGTTALAMALLLFFIHVNEKPEIKTDTQESSIASLDVSDIPLLPVTPKKVPLMDWKYAQENIPWNILFLFSGGFALNLGFQDSGLDSVVGEKLKSLTHLPLFWLLLCITLFTSFMSNFTANTACANLLLPIITAVAQKAEKYHPWLLMIPTALATSICFGIPVGTPPNLIALGTGRIVMKDFLTVGIVFDIVSVLVVSIIPMLLIPPVFDAHQFPDWAKSNNSVCFQY